MLQTIAWISLAIAAICFVIICSDELRRPQKMQVMNFVWPITALYLGPVAVWAYFRIGGRMSRSQAKSSSSGSADSTPQRKQIGWTTIAVSSSHCGAGCTLADILCEWLVFVLGWKLLDQSLFASYLLDLVVAWLFGIAFQYFAIRPMKQLSAGDALAAAVKADTLSIIAFQAGMYAWMALVYFVWWPAPHLTPNEPAFWLMMQIAMIFGFLTTWPMNRWLLRKGLKEQMG